MSQRKKSRTKRLLALVGALLFIAALVMGYLVYVIILKPNVHISDEFTYLYIPTGSSFEDVKRILLEEKLVDNAKSFEWVAREKNYPRRILPGRYKIYNNMDNNILINLLRSGEQEPVNVTFNNIRTREQLSGKIASYLECDSLSLLKLLNDDAVMQEYGLNRETGILLFIPDTYQFFWNTSAEQVLDRMHREYVRFWNPRRRKQAEKIGISPVEVGILASIIRQETSKKEELERIAGVYINRINRKIPLEADPTIVFAVGDYSINRVLEHHLKINSPYNTYKNIGLPPGPISLPEPYIIDAVLNYENHDYVFFCARDDFSGYHVFAKTYSEHLVNAKRYHKALTEKRIMK